jgi:ferric iron reductase protein FhuF
MNPLADTLRRLGPAADGLSLVALPSERLAPADELIRRRRTLAGAVETFAGGVGTDEQAVAASLFAQAWAVSVTRAAIACLAGERRVPDVAAANSALVFDGTGRPVGVVLNAPRFAAVAGDAACSDPAAEPVADLAALCAWTRRQVFGRHLGPLVEALTAFAPVGRRLLWGNVAAACAGGFAVLSGRGMDAGRLVVDAATFLDPPDAPTRGLAHLVPVEHDGRTYLFVRRETCCLYNRLPGAPSCLSCRLLDDEERQRRIRIRLNALTSGPAR